MANDTEDVKYSFQGDTSSLRKATQDAIEQLNRFEGAIQKVASQDGFKASRTSVQGLQRAVNSLTTQTNALTKVLNTTSSALDQMMPKGAAEVANVTSELAESVRYLESVSGATSTDLQLVTSVLKDLGGTMSTVSAQAAALGTSLKATDSVQQQATQSINTVSTALDSAAKSAEPLLRVFPRIQDAYQLSGKSALESARVFASSESVWRRMQVELTNVGQVAARAWNQFTAPLKTVEQKIQSFKDKVKSVFAKVETWFAPFSKALRRTAQESEEASHKFNALALSARKTSNALKPLSSTTNLLSKAFVALTGVQIGDWLADAAKQSISYLENLNLFTVAMGDAVEEGTAFVNTMQELYGMDPSNLMRYAGNFYQLATAIEMPDAAATNLSLVLTKASNDIASLFNMDIETVFENLASGMQGMSRAVRKYGMDIRTTTLQTEAAALGIYDQVESMSEANRMGLRFLTMMKQASNASGDFARTIETPANQLRIFKEQMSQLGRAIGNFFIGPLGTAIAYINGFIMALRTALTFIASMVGIITGFSNAFDSSSAEEEADAIAGVGDAAGTAAKKMKSLLSPFDELNILQDKSKDSGGSGGLSSDIMDPRIADAIAGMEAKFEEIEMKANRVRNAILEFFGFTVDLGKIVSWNPDILEENLINKFPQWTKTIQATFDHWGEIIDGFKAVFKSLGGVVASMKNKVLDFFSTFINDDSVSQFISSLSGNLQNLANWITQHEDSIANFALTFVSLWGAFKLFSGVATILGPVVTTISKIVEVLTPLGSVFSTLVGLINPVVIAIAAVVGVFALAYTQFESVRGAVDGLKDSFSQMVDNVSEAFKALWDDIFKPVLDNIASGLKELWSDHLSKLVEEIGLDVAAIIDFVMSVVGVVSELITFLSSTFGPIVSTVVNTVVDLFKTFLGAVSDVVTRMLAVLRGLITFITGVFQGDWSKAWSGIVTAFKNVFGLVKDILKGIINVCIDLINGLVSAVWNAVRGIINGIGSIARQIGELLGKRDWGWKLTAQPPKIPHLKTGGVVTSPTYALIGEGGKDEAVIPLDNSPQMAQLVKQIADAVRDIPRGGGSGSGNQPIEVRVFLDSREITSAQNRNNRMYGKTTQNV